MLRKEVIDAIEQGKFHIYEVNTIEEGIAILTGIATGKMNEDNQYEDGSIYRKVADKLSRFAELTNPEKE